VRGRSGARLAGYALAERAKILATLKRLEEFRLEGWDRTVVDRLLSPPHEHMGLRGLEHGRRVPGPLFVLVIEALADGVNGKAKSQDREGGAGVETQAPPGLRRYGGELLALENWSIPCVKGVAKRPLEARKVCAVGAMPREDRRKGLRLEEARQKPARVAERGMRGRMGHEIGLDEVVEGSRTQSSGEGPKVPTQAILDPEEVGVRVHTQAIFRRKTAVAAEEPRERHLGLFLGCQGGGDPLRFADEPPKPSLEPAESKFGRFAHPLPLLPRAP